MSTRKRILSGIQPTAGDPHFGNYFGALQNWVKLQDEFDCVYTVVNYHAMTMPYDPAKLRENTWHLTFNLLALGVKPEYLCIQSLVPEHAELCWILNNFCAYGELAKMTQFKDKREQLEEKDNQAFISAGLFDYPVLQAADILIYRADLVPVGKDQEQHLELARNIANRFNYSVGNEYFKMPEALYTEAPKIMSLADPTRKMSKSLGDKHFISLFEDEKVLRKKVRSAVTDGGDTTSDTMSAGVESLYTLLKLAASADVYNDFLQQYQEGSRQYGKLKDAVADALIDHTRKFIAQRAELLEQRTELETQIRESSANIRLRAQETLREVKELAGLANV